MFDLSKLNQPMDLNKIDVNELLNKLLKQKVVLAKVVVVVLALIMAGFLLNNFLKEKKEVEAKVQQLQQNIASIQTFRMTKKQYESFKEHLPKAVDDDAIVPTISALGEGVNVSASDFSPITNKTFDTYDTASVTMTMHAKTFKDMVLFFKAVEESAQALRIDSYTVVEAKDEGIIFSILVTTLKFK